MKKTFLNKALGIPVSTDENKRVCLTLGFCSILADVRSRDPDAPAALAFMLCTEGQVQRLLFKENLTKTEKSKNRGTGFWSDHEPAGNNGGKVVTGGI